MRMMEEEEEGITVYAQTTGLCDLTPSGVDINGDQLPIFIIPEVLYRLYHRQQRYRSGLKMCLKAQCRVLLRLLMP